MFKQRILQFTQGPGNRLRGRFRGFANAGQQAEATRERQKVAETFFEKAMWPLIAATVVAGVVGYQYYRLLNRTGPGPAPLDKRDVSEVRKESKNEKDFQQKLYNEVESDRDKIAERAYSKGTLAKSTLFASPDASEEEKNKEQYPSERQAALTKPGVRPSA